MMKNLLIIILFFVTIGIVAAAQELQQETSTAALTIQVNQPEIKVSSSLYGIFFEEINHAGDGGLYPELIRNRSFEFKAEPEFWTITAQSAQSGTIKIEKNSTGSQYNSNVLQVHVLESKSGFAVVNEGYWGIPVTKDEEYHLTVKSKAENDFNGSLDFVIQSSDGKSKRASVTLENLAKDWKMYEFNFRAETDDPNARLAIVPSSTGTFQLDYVSLKPVKTYKNHGLRIDLMEKLAALKPAFVRFPGGCWVEGNTMNEASRWKRTIGQEIDRWTQPNLWGYHSTNGLGYHEYLQMCEDLNADAMFVINCGMSHKDNVPMDKMDEYVQDALDAIEYANGAADSTWGKIRAENGHPKPFSLKYIEIGNENGGPVYWERYDYFYTKIREKYKDIQIIANQWRGNVTNKNPVEIFDEHYYNNPTFFIRTSNRYDKYERSGSKIYVGEYAVTQGCGKGNLDGAIGEAAFMTGMEKNSDVVILSSYAPLFVNVRDRRWNPDLIVFDGTRSYGIPSYYVQQLFSLHRSDVIVPNSIVSYKNEQKYTGAVGVGSWNTKVEYKDAKISLNGNTLLETKLDKTPENAVAKNGDWKFEDGVLRQKSNASDCRYFFGSNAWNDRTFSVKARKIEGTEGFLILFLAAKDDIAWLNIGGWNNSRTGIEFNRQMIGEANPFTVETNRWYDIRIELKGRNVRCFIDDQFLFEQELPVLNSTPLYIVSGLNEKQDELITKIVNTSSKPCETTISLEGITKIHSVAKEVVLTSENGSDENTLDQPQKVSPRESEFSIDSPNFSRIFPANSLTILRIKIK
ncbi:MAG: carbohydrate binding domain-containing protein [Planctomycetaceae bacterium]|jgi:alpha-L-arabinofuranosidase|nr:carbohydrate binding domain-containing protein [Planctomycetaceae bacterium]